MTTIPGHTHLLAPGGWPRVLCGLHIEKDRPIGPYTGLRWAVAYTLADHIDPCRACIAALGEDAHPALKELTP